MTEHRQHQCDKEWCTVCRNKQKHCTVCGTRDKEQPTDCPGYQLSEAKKDAVYHGDLDFKGGEWVDGLL